ncbi:MAG: Holliday junction branch migration protein RuvA [bacterium]|nr:Holliday junction branch migration protein RuvA [bacterium]
MIGRLTGTVLECAPDRVLLDVNGVGYTVQIPLGTFYALSARTDGERVSLHITTHVREDALLLFGFDSGDERELFERLITISGVGPRLAISILSGIEADELRETVVARDRTRLQKIPGVGKKTAERLLLELQDKLDPKRAAGTPPPALSGRGKPAGLREDALSALVNLGYAREAALRAVDSALDGREADPALEELLRSALRSLVGTMKR